MPVSKAVAALNTDLANLARYSNAQHAVEHKYNVDVVKQKAALAAIDLEKKKITDQFAGPTQPTGATEVKLLNQLFALGQKREQTIDSFAVTLKNDKSVIAHDAAAAKAWKARGLHDLLPAEYQLNLAETNKDRKALGLGAVKTVIRPPKPPAPKPTTYTVKAGDTMSGIAKSHNMTLAALIKLNPQVSNPNNISVGQKLNIKAGPVPPAPKPGPLDAKRAAALAFAIKQANDPNVGYSQDGDKRFGQNRGAGNHRYYDCSGLVASAYASVGMTLGGANDTRTMWNTWNRPGSAWATQVPKDVSKMKAGDLVLVNSNPPNKDEHHVLLYLGGGKCVAASTDGIPFQSQVRVGDSAQSYFDQYGSSCIVLRPFR